MGDGLFQRAGRAEVAENKELIRTLVSMSTRSRSIIGQQFGQAFFGESAVAPVF